MKTKIFAVSTIIIIIVFVSINNYFLKNEITRIMQGVESLDTDAENASESALRLQKEFRRSENYISITVSHDDLTNIEDGFAELVGCLTVGDLESAWVVKSRLINSLEHLRRLSGINFDSII